jgi:glutaredoxin 3
VQKLIRENKVMIFSATYCSYCNVAKRTLDSLGTKFESIELNKVDEGPELARDLKEITGNNYASVILFV